MWETSAFSYPNFFGPSTRTYICRHSMINSSQIAHGDRSRREKIFYVVDRAPTLAKIFVMWVLMRDLFAVANLVCYWCWHRCGHGVSRYVWYVEVCVCVACTVGGPLVRDINYCNVPGGKHAGRSDRVHISCARISSLLVCWPVCWCRAPAGIKLMWAAFASGYFHQYFEAWYWYMWIR